MAGESQRGERTRLARQLAGEFGVSERLARVEAGELTYEEMLQRLPASDGDAPRRCAWCGEPLPAEATIRREYCSDRCRVAAGRAGAEN